MASSVLTIWLEDATTLSITHALMRAFCGLHVVRSRRSFDVADHQRLHFDNIACDLVGGPVSLHGVFRQIDRGFHGRTHELVCRQDWQVTGATVGCTSIRVFSIDCLEPYLRQAKISHPALSISSSFCIRGQPSDRSSQPACSFFTCGNSADLCLPPPYG